MVIGIVSGAAILMCACVIYMWSQRKGSHD